MAGRLDIPMFSELPMPLAGINTLVSSAVDSFFRITESLLLTRLVSLLQVSFPPPTLVIVMSPVDASSIAGH